MRAGTRGQKAVITESTRHGLHRSITDSSQRVVVQISDSPAIGVFRHAGRPKMKVKLPSLHDLVLCQAVSPYTERSTNQLSADSIREDSSESVRFN
jgi:hypothetical protein